MLQAEGQVNVTIKDDAISEDEKTKITEDLKGGGFTGGITFQSKNSVGLDVLSSTTAAEEGTDEAAARGGSGDTAEQQRVSP